MSQKNSCRSSFSLQSSSSFFLEKVSPKLVPIKLKLYNTPYKKITNTESTITNSIVHHRYSCNSEKKDKDSKKYSRGISLTLSPRYRSYSQNFEHYFQYNKKTSIKHTAQKLQLKNFFYQHQLKISKSQNSKKYLSPHGNMSKYLIKNQKTTQSQLKSIVNRCKGLVNVNQDKRTIQKTNDNKNIFKMDYKTTQVKRKTDKLFNYNINDGNSLNKQEKKKIQQKTIQKGYFFNMLQLQKQNHRIEVSQLAMSPLSIQITNNPVFSFNLQKSPFQLSSNRKNSYSPHNQLLINQQKSIKTLKQIGLQSPNQKNMQNCVDKIQSNENQKQDLPKVDEFKDNSQVFQALTTQNTLIDKIQSNLNCHLDTPKIKSIKNKIIKLQDVSTVQSKQTSPQFDQLKTSCIIFHENRPSQAIQNCQVFPIKKIVFQTQTSDKKSKNETENNHIQILQQKSSLQNMTIQKIQTLNDINDKKSITHNSIQNNLIEQSQLEDSFFQKYQLHQCQQFQNCAQNVNAKIKPVKRRLSLQSQSQNKKIDKQQEIEQTFFIQQILSSLKKNNFNNKQKSFKFQVVKKCSNNLLLLKQQKSQWIFGAGRLKSMMNDKQAQYSQHYHQHLIQLKNPNCLNIYCKTKNFYLTQAFQYSLDQLYSLNLLPQNQLQHISKILKELTIEIHKLDESLKFDMQKISSKIVYIHGVFKFIPLVVKNYTKLNLYNNIIN